MPSREWWTCRRKVKYQEEPPPRKGVYSYQCPYCAGWHLATRRGPESKQPAKLVLRGGFWIEK